MVESEMFWISLLLASAVPIVIGGGLISRSMGASPKGIGWQFIRYTVIAISIPTIALLALNKSLSGEVVALIGTVVGFAFGKANGNE